jgi:hypothetical protein
MQDAVTESSLTGNAEEAIRALSYEGLRYRNDYYFHSFPVYQRLMNIAFHHGSQRILELGAGLSTALWARYAHRTGASVMTVDADFAPMCSYVESPKLSTLIDEHVQLVKGVTITSQQLSDFYHTSHETFCGVPASAIAETIETFSRPAPQPRIDAVQQALGSTYWTLRDTFIHDGQTISFPPKLLDKLSPSGRFARDVDFLNQHPLAEIHPTETWDLIFFDSGEYSSCVEWLTLKDRIPVGGLAAFHDVFFPKSAKNFLPCAAILADTNWRVVLLDDSTIQGLLIAQRLN